MAKKLLGLNADGKLVLKLPSGKTEPVTMPVSARAFLLIDCSSSMASGKIAQAREGALAFAKDALKKHYAVGLISFATKSKTLCVPEQNLTMLASTIERLEANGTTNMADAIKQATKHMEKCSGIRAIVIVTDGVPDDPNLTLGAAKQAKKAGIDIIAIGTDDADQQFLAQIASRTDLAFKVSRTELKSGITHAAKMLPGATGTK
jgi:Mg-chelatase subunit ChlD